MSGLILTLWLMGFPEFSALSAVFTNDSLIGVGNGHYELQDIVVSNCVLTVDGPHNFASLRVAGTGVVTHSFSSNGVIAVVSLVTNEAQLLSGTNTVTLSNANVVVASVLVTDSGNTVIYTNGVDYVLSDAGGGLTALQRGDTSTIPDGATVLVSYNFGGTVNAGLSLTVSGSVEVESGASIAAPGRGYGAGLGIGSGRQAGNPGSGSGGGYGGYGGLSSSNAAGGLAYGSVFAPSQLGSGGGGGIGGPGGAGGGSIRLVIGGNLVVNGTVSANGLSATNSRAGGGAGGSIWATAQAIQGTGAFTANGGAGEPVHGGGGGAGELRLRWHSSPIRTIFFRGASRLLAVQAGNAAGRGLSSSEELVLPGG